MPAVIQDSGMGAGEPVDIGDRLVAHNIAWSLVANPATAQEGKGYITQSA